MAYNKIVSKTIGFKTRDLELAIFLCLQGVNKACDCRYSLSLETLSYYSPLTCHARPACYMRYMHGMHVNKLLKPVYKINHECSLCPLISTVFRYSACEYFRLGQACNNGLDRKRLMKKKKNFITSYLMCVFH